MFEKECIMKTLKLAIAAALASVLAAGTAHAGPPSDWIALKVNRQATKTVKAEADRGEASTDQRRSDSDVKVKTPRKAPAMTWRFGGPNRY
jgi:hypothetical protein